MGDSRPRRVVFEAGCFIYEPASLQVWFMHRSWQSYGSGRTLSLNAWEDDYGFAFSFIPPASPAAYSLVCGIAANRYSECSIGWLTKKSRIERFGGEPVEFIQTALVHEISIVPRGACPGTACWQASNAPDQIPQHARALLSQWSTGYARYCISAAAS